eukprot:7179802-Heterocapsa_arctica.AAC.1
MISGRGQQAVLDPSSRDAWLKVALRQPAPVSHWLGRRSTRLPVARPTRAVRPWRDGFVLLDSRHLFAL